MLTCSYLWELRDAYHAGFVPLPTGDLIAWFSANCWAIGQLGVNILTGPRSGWTKRAADQVDGGDLVKCLARPKSTQA